MDKVKHFAVGLVVSLIAGLIFNPMVGLLLAATLGAAKEVYDAYTPGHEEFLDFLWTFAGGFVSFVIITL